SIRVVDGRVRPGMNITFGATDKVFEVDEVGHMRLGRSPQEELGPGEVGYLTAAIKEVEDTKVGDTILDADDRAEELLPGYQDVKPMVFSGLYPTDSDQFEELRDALDRLKLNDASLFFEPETSTALGFGFRCGFLGLLHMEVVQERLEREFDLDLVTTVPNVEYHVLLTDGGTLEIENPTAMPDPGRIERIEEPFVRARILCPADYIGNVQKLCHDRRGEFVSMQYPDPNRVEFTFHLPLAEVVLDFYDRLKSSTRGYASLDWEFLEFRESDLVRLDMLINGDPIDAFSVIIHRDKAYEYGRAIARKLKELIPRQQFEVALQASIGTRIIARETIRALRKNVTAKCYGGDVTRKRKLLEKQKEGKKRMKQVGTVEIPQEAFLAVLQVDG
ncbi:MAG: translation elongation factor 4, partial [Gemmatimonadota bacterium]